MDRPVRFVRWLRDPETDRRIDQAVLQVDLAPRSYTGEDTVEIFRMRRPDWP